MHSEEGAFLGEYPLLLITQPPNLPLQSEAVFPVDSLGRTTNQEITRDNLNLSRLGVPKNEKKLAILRSHGAHGAKGDQITALI